MHVAIVNLTGGGMSGGYRKYLRRILPLLQSDARISELSVFVPPALLPTLSTLARSVQTWRSSAELKQRIAQLRPAVVFVPTARHLDLGRTPVVTMVRNMEPLLVPFNGNGWREGVKNLARAWDARRAARGARRTIAVSQFVSDVIVRRWHLDPSRVGVVPHGVDPPHGDASGRVFADGPFLFTAGSIRPARGLEDAIEALSLLEPARRLRLVIAGSAAGAPAYEQSLRRLADARGVSNDVVWAGELSEAEMRTAFNACAIFVMTSRAEACPNVVLEAMSAGCASVSVDQPPMPEFYAESALYYRAGHGGELAERVSRLLQAKDEAARLRTAARLQAGRFTWANTSDLTIRQLQLAAA